MPYIKQYDRKVWESAGLKSLMDVVNNSGCTPGDLNFLMTSLAAAYVASNGLNYTHLNDVVGVFESAKTEFQRRVVAPYEDTKIKENGDTGVEETEELEDSADDYCGAW